MRLGFGSLNFIACHITCGKQSRQDGNQIKHSTGPKPQDLTITRLKRIIYIHLIERRESFKGVSD